MGVAELYKTIWVTRFVALETDFFGLATVGA